MVGPVTIGKVNSADPQSFHARILHARIQFIEDLVQRDPTQQRFEKGWKNRLTDFGFQAA
jgi:hypothetical protein